MSRYRATYVSGLRISGVYEANSGSLASGAESADITVAHGLATTPDILGGALRDGSWAAQVGWRFVSIDATNIKFRFLNHGPNTATAILRFRLIY